MTGRARIAPFVLAAALVAALPAAALAAKDVRAVVLTNGKLAGRVSVVARVHHPADATRARDDMLVTLSRRGHVLASQVDPFRRSARAAIDAPHRIVLSAAESRVARAAARKGRLRVTVASASAAAAAVRGLQAPREAEGYTATVALTTSSEDPLEAMYTTPSPGPPPTPDVTVYQSDMHVTGVDVTAYSRIPGQPPIVASWQASLPITCGVAPAIYGDQECTWSNSGSETWSFASGNVTGTPTVSGGGSFEIFLRSAYLYWDEAGDMPKGFGSMSAS